MPVLAHFRHSGFTPEKYDELIRRLEDAGHGSPAGRLSHAAVEVDGEIEVYDVWESQAAMDAWGPEGIVPILIELGVELSPPAIEPTRNVIVG
jgi:hypothetical protein